MCGKGPQEAVSRSMDIDRDRMTVEFASKVADLGNWAPMERILFSHKTMTMISGQNLYGDQSMMMSFVKCFRIHAKRNVLNIIESKDGQLSKKRTHQSTLFLESHYHF